MLTRVHNGAIASGGQAWLILGTYSNLLSSVAGYFYIFYTLHVYERNMLPNFVKKYSLEVYCTIYPILSKFSSTLFRYWSRVLIPHGKDKFLVACPFCALPLERDGYIKLILQTQFDGKEGITV